MSNYPTPQIIIGKPSTGQQGDSSAQAYNKYNIHTHSLAQSSNPLLLGIRPNFIVSAVNENGTSLFIPGTKVVSLDNNQITLDNYPFLSSSNAIVYFTDNLNNSNVITINNIELQNVDNFIELPLSKGGFVSASQSDYIPLTNFNGFITLNNPLVNNVFPLIINNISKAYLYKLDLQLLSANNNAIVSSNISLLVDNLNIATYSLVNTSAVSLNLDLNTTTYSGLLNPGASFKLFINSLSILEPSILLAYNLYLYRV
jgi:hypothetical protein